jgi:hypothetical protein
VGSGALGERGSGRLGSASCRLGSGPGAARERGGAWALRKKAGSVGDRSGAGSGGRERVGERGSGTLPLGARFGENIQGPFQRCSSQEVQNMNKDMFTMSRKNSSSLSIK